jgi:ppGpp synthetase/RelA/SpoT-type nucleotidyltranferase
MFLDPERETHLRTEFREQLRNFTVLTGEIEKILREIVKVAKIESPDVHARTKLEDSFLSKCIRKNYTDPFNQAMDISGCRVVCLYIEDIDRIEAVIRSSFSVDEENSTRHDRPDDPARFGYSSRHLVVTLREPLEEGIYHLKGMKAEVQVRTALQHVWAAIEHQLQYKKELDKPEGFRRRFSRIAAMLDVVDEEFSDLRAETKAALRLVAKSEEVRTASDATTPSPPRKLRRKGNLARYLNRAGLSDALLIKEIISEKGKEAFASKEAILKIVDEQRRIVEQSQAKLDAAKPELERLSEKVTARSENLNGVARLSVVADANRLSAEVDAASQEIRNAGAKIAAVERLIKFVAQK